MAKWKMGRWVELLRDAGVLAGLLVLAWVVVRIVDGAWASWQLPVIFIIVWIMTVAVGALVLVLLNIRKGMNKINKP